ncbi:beta-ketoacyl synthase [Rhodococcus sp. 1168]|uniref:beta-ketoacyl-[acyl-carrier-protein] synthase family protein n=1 Tax=Rhodococcus sp. 1168 TaxID=2018041 RepID=UPI000A0A2C3B|nr:beta-ketoacyl-[acyl-carrier-protein] synthase family protein [Rhodococcus sp. 1168]ORI21248.1 3-oxoacyl-ACP synthase [Rhodococcus sp. 1168]
MSTRVVITGLGPVSSIGIGVEEFCQGIRGGRSGISAIDAFDTTGFPAIMAGEVNDFVPDSYLSTLESGEWGRASLFAAAAARLAVADAGISPELLETHRAGSVMGTTGGESRSIELIVESALADGPASIDPNLIKNVPSARISEAVNVELGMNGEALTIATACSASNYAVGYAYDQLASGEADYMIAGGADSVLRWAHAGFYRLGALTEKACSPFDVDRSGILTGEGGAAIFLETLESATERGAHIYAEVLGYGVNCDAIHMVAPDSASIAACARTAHANAGIDAADVDYICAHGTGTPANDAAETTAMKSVFGAEPPPMSSIKSMLGHTMGAASGFGVIASCLGIDNGFMPPTINFTELDPALTGIDPVPNHARSADVRLVQNNGFAFGGNNAIVILSKVG